MKLNYKKIVDKKFETVINGYSPTQVDIFLDKICLDYMDYDKKILELESEIDALKNENLRLKNQETNLKNASIEQTSQIDIPNKTSDISKTQDIDIKVSKI